MTSNRVQAGRNAAGVGGLLAARMFFEIGPRDTNRLAAGFARAHNALLSQLSGQAQFAPLPVPQLRASSLGGEILEVLQKQLERRQKSLEYWKGVAEKQAQRLPKTPKGRPGYEWPSYAKLTRRIRGIERSVARAEQTLEQYLALGPDVPVIAIRGRGRSSSKLSSLTSLRLKTYGGTASLQRTGIQGWTVKLTNREPHVRIVDRKQRLSARVTAELRRSIGARRIGRAYAERLALGLEENVPRGFRRGGLAAA